MNFRLYKTLTWLLWLALPLTALRYWLVWDQLPPRMATHFDANWNANGWMTREASFYFAVGVTAFLLLVFTTILLFAQLQKGSSGTLWFGVAFAYVVIGFIFFVNSKVVSYNLGGGSIDLNFVMLLLPLGLFGLTALYLRSKRGEPLPQTEIIAEEVHSSPLFGAVMMLPALILLSAVTHSPIRAVLPMVGLICIFMLISGASAWSGFHYFFTHSGVEIRTLGFRLRSIPLEQITRYVPGDWPFWRGYGIRGIGSSRAYVWGNRGVWIDTTHGNAFLGHDNPEAIVRDLDRIKQSVR